MKPRIICESFDVKYLQSVAFWESASQEYGGKVTILNGLTITFATLVTCHCLNNSAVTSMWGRHGGADYHNCCRFVTSLLCGRGIHRFWRNLNLCFCPAVGFQFYFAVSVLVTVAMTIHRLWCKSIFVLFLLAEFHPVGKGKKCVFNLCFDNDDHDDNTIDDNDNLPWWFCCLACSCQSLSQPLFLGTSRIDVDGSFLNLQRLKLESLYIQMKWKFKCSDSGVDQESKFNL